MIVNIGKPILNQAARNVAVREQIESELKRIFTVEEFDDPKRRKEILGPLPDQEKFCKEQRKVDVMRQANGFPAALRPCYEAALLSQKQEYHLFRKYHYLKYRAKKRFDVGHLRDAQKYIQKARAIRNQITEANVRLAPNVVHYNPDKEDQLAEAYANVMKAVDYFDYRRGFKFSTYCTWVLKKNSCRQYHEEQRHFAISSDFEDLQSRDSGHEVESNYRTVQRAVRRLLKKVTPREAFVLKNRFGIDCEPMTLKDIGKVLGVSKERIRQLEKRGLDMLRGSKSKDLVLAGEYDGVNQGI